MSIWEKAPYNDIGANWSILRPSDRDRWVKVEDLKALFKDGPDTMNFILFSTSGISGHYGTIEEAEDYLINGCPDGEEGIEEGWVNDVTFVIVHPRVICMRYGNVIVETEEDLAYLRDLRQLSWDAVARIGRG